MSVIFIRHIALGEVFSSIDKRGCEYETKNSR